ncbi:MAG: PIN domain-containing protein [Candidatus Omnitrophota bacterium]
MITSETALLDANVLVYAYDESSPYHAAALQLVEKGRGGEISLCLTPQVLNEFFAVITDPRRVAHHFTAQEALQEMVKFYRSKRILTIFPNSLTIEIMLELLKRHPVVKQDIFDLQLAATMLANNITRIYTYNAEDFIKFSEIETLTP